MSATERIVMRRKGTLCVLTTPQGNAKLLGASATAEEMILEEHDTPPAEFPDTEFLTHMICVAQQSVPCSLFWKDGGVEKKGALRPGTVGLSTAKPQTGIRWDGRFHALVLSIGLQTMEQALPEPFTRPPIELITLRAGDRDPVLEHLMGALRGEFERRQPSGRLVLDSLANTTAFYLAQRYGASPPRPYVHKSGMARERITRVLDYIETYLATDLSVMELSSVACLSPYHFGKMFKLSMDQTVHQYVVHRRVERAKSLLSARTLTLSEIAVAVGFQDQSHFTTIFKRHTGVTPGAYIRNRSVR